MARSHPLVAEGYYGHAKDLEYGHEAEVVLVQRQHGQHGDTPMVPEE
jgi:hypothetical protein